jgi:hypothetical protein
MDRDYDEIVRVDANGVGITRRDCPAVDFPVDTRVELAGVAQVLGTVVGPLSRPPHGLRFYVLVRWDIDPENITWQHVDGLRTI